MYELDGFIVGTCIFVSLFLVDALFNEPFFERLVMPLLLEFALLDFQFLTEQFQGVAHRCFQNFGYRGKARLVLLDYAGIGRNGNLTVGKCVQCIDCNIGRNARLKFYQNFGIFGGVVVNFPDFYLVLLVGFQYGVDDSAGCLSVWNLLDCQGFLINLFDAGTDEQFSTALTVVVAAHIDKTASGEVGIKLHGLVAEHCNTAVEQFVEVVRQNYRVETYGNTFDALSKQQRELYRQVYRFLLTTVV